MFKSKTTTVITLTLAICAMASQASAQTSPQTLETAHPVLSQTTKSVEAKRKAMPTGTTARKVTRVVKAVPTQSTATTEHELKNVYGWTINANASEQKAQTRFIYTQRKDDTKMPVYFSEESLKSK